MRSERYVVMIAAAVLTAVSAAAHDPVIHSSRENGRPLPLPENEDMFHFVIFGDRTGGPAEGIAVLEQAVADTNLLDPDLVMTVGDLVQGYNEPPEWMEQMREFRGVMEGLKMPWFPVAGNHDIYWRAGEGGAPPPPQEHEDNYEKHFGPLWYWFEHKDSGFLVLYTDEGPSPKTYSGPENVRMSEAQLLWLRQALGEMRELDNVFVFLHHPRWIGGGYEGGNWDAVHEALAAAGNVRAVFAGHIHRLRYDGVRDGIGYYALATTGGAMPGDYPGIGYVHHLNVVTVRKKEFSMAILPVGAAIDPEKYTPERLGAFDAVRAMPLTLASDPVLVQSDGKAVGAYRLEVANPAPAPIELTVSPESAGAGWLVLPDHQHVKVGAGEKLQIALTYAFTGDSASLQQSPVLRIETDFLDDNARVALPGRSLPLQVEMAPVDEAFFATDAKRVLALGGEASALRVASDALDLPDGPFTLECWARPEQSQANAALLAKTEMSEFGILLRDGIPRFQVFLGDDYKSVDGVEPIEAARWSHVAGVFDGAELRLYVNGSRVASREASGQRKRNQLPFFIGADPDRDGAPSRGFSGRIDDVRLSSIARYSEDTFVPPAGESGVDDHTVAFFDCDRAVATFVPGRSASGTISATLAGDKAGLVEGGVE